MIGIRREDKSRWEGRVPLVPDDVRQLVQQQGVTFQVQASRTRAFPDSAYADAGAAVVDDLAACPLVMGVKEIPPACFEPRKTYVYFSHTIKGQAANMPALKRLLELGCTLIDYERIVDEQNRRLVFFGRFAGLAGMIDTLWALGQRLSYEGIASPFAQVRKAHEYHDLEHCRAGLKQVADAIRRDGLPAALRPFVCGFAGYGQVSQGAQQIYDMLPTRAVAPEDLPSLRPDPHTCYKVVFREEHMARPKDAARPFELQEYYKHPERYASAFIEHVTYLSVLVNGIYWEPKYPRLITREQFDALYSAPTPPRLRVIGDVSCDIDGAVACTTRTTDPGSPVYVYEPGTGRTRDGVEGAGPVVLAVDFLPCELPVDASRYFSGVLRPFVPALARAKLDGALADSGLPRELQRAVIVHRGELTEPYRYLEQHVR